MSLTSEVSPSSQHPRAGVLWVGEVKDADSIDDLISSASISGRPSLDFEDLDFS